MAKHPESETQKSENDFERVGQSRNLTLVEEFWFFLAYNKKWWLIPILVVFAVLGLMVVLATTGAAPFIYPMGV